MKPNSSYLKCMETDIETIKYNLSKQHYCEGNEKITWSYGTTYFVNDIVECVDGILKNLLRTIYSKKKVKKIIESNTIVDTLYKSGTLSGNGMESVLRTLKSASQVKKLVDNPSLEDFPVEELVSAITTFYKCANHTLKVFNKMQGQ